MSGLLKRINAIEDVDVNPKTFETPIKKKETYEHTLSLTSQHGISSYSYRRANFFQQLYYLIKRNIIGALRNPRGMNAVLMVSIFQSLMMCTIFEGVGQKRLWDIESEVKKIPRLQIKKKKERAIELVSENMTIVKDFNGFIFFCATDQYISIMQIQNVQMPELSDIFRREMGNKMYSPTAFFIARWFVSTLIYCF